MTRRILVIRGGAIGDFILTLPAMALLRAEGARLEVMGYQRVLGLVHQRYYAEDTRPIESAALAACFHPRAQVNPALAEYLAAFDEIISYIYDPDELFASTLRRIGVKNLLAIPPILNGSAPAVRQLLGPIAARNPSLEHPHPTLHPSDADRRRAAEILPAPVDVVVHPGSGSAAKTWPASHWLTVIRELKTRGLRVAICGGEAEEPSRHLWEREAGSAILWNLPLETLAACLQQVRLFLGHDSGISHLACAAGVPACLLFGPTDPAVWAPPHPHAHTIQAPAGRLEALTPDMVIPRVEALL